MSNKVEPTFQMKGGIIINNNITSQIPEHLINFENCFYYFIKNSKWEYIKGSNLSAAGVIFKCTLLDEIESPFINIRLANIANPVKEIVIKFVVLDNERGKYDYYYHENDKIQKKEKKYENPSRFLNEIQIQNELTKEDLLFLDPICPFLIYNDVVGENDWTTFYNKIFTQETQLTLLENIELFENFNAFKNINEAREIARKFNESENKTNVSMMYLSQIVEHCIKTKHSLAFIGMEMLENSYPLYNYYISRKTHKDEHIFALLANIVIYEAIQLAIKGVVHGDLHLDNVFIKENYKPYFNDINIKAIIIDYGYANKINYEKRMQIIQKWNEICDIPDENIDVQPIEEKMGELIRLVFNSPRIDGGIVIFDWVKKFFNPKFIYNIHKKRMACIDETIIPLINSLGYDEDEIEAGVYQFTRKGGRVIKENQSRLSFLSDSSSSFKPSNFSRPSKKSKSKSNTSKTSKSSQRISIKDYLPSKRSKSYKMFVPKKSYKPDISFDKALKELQDKISRDTVTEGTTNTIKSNKDNAKDIKKINKNLNEYFHTLYENNEKLEKKLSEITSKNGLSSKNAKTRKLYISKSQK